MTLSSATLSRVNLGIADSIQEVLEHIHADIESLMTKEIEATLAINEEIEAARKTLSSRLQIEEGRLADLDKVVDAIRA
jgi:hypothetical protein